MNIIQFEETLAQMRFELYRHPPVDIIKEGFRPVSGQVADFCVVEHGGRHHFFYIERRLTEGTPFYPGNEIYFGHASTPDLFEWEVHDPVMLIRPGTWESAHVWAPFVLAREGRFVMAYTGLNAMLSQDIGLAFSDDLFDWHRSPDNPISPCKDQPWSFWREDGIASCRDPHLLKHDGRIWMTYTANTSDGRACVAMASTADLREWEDHGPILRGPKGGYEPRLEGGHLQGSLESTNLRSVGGDWILIVSSTMRHSPIRHWAFRSSRMDRFELSEGWEFWPECGCIEVVKSRGSKSLTAGVSGGRIRFGEVAWEQERPAAASITDANRLRDWL